MSEHDPTPSPAAPDDRELEAFLSRRSPLSQAYREALPPERVPENIDAAVKAWAEREHAQHLGPRGRWWDRAALPLGAAASLILVGLLVYRGHESGVSEREAMREAATAASMPQAGTAKPATAESAPVTTPPPAVTPAATARTPSTRDLKAAAPRMPTASLKPSQTLTENAPPAREPAPVSAPAASPTGGAAADAAVEAKQPTTAAEDRSSTAEKTENAPAQRMAGMLSSSGNAMTRAETAPAPALPPAAMQAAPAPFPSAPAAAVQPRAASARAQASFATASEAQLQRCEQTATAQGLDAQSYPPSGAWLDGIRQLRDANQSDAAHRQLRCWQRVYPQSAVPDDLKDRVGEP